MDMNSASRPSNQQPKLFVSDRRVDPERSKKAKEDSRITGKMYEEIFDEECEGCGKLFIPRSGGLYCRQCVKAMGNND